jgi:hypothetical protein
MDRKKLPDFFLDGFQNILSGRKRQKTLCRHHFIIHPDGQFTNFSFGIQYGIELCVLFKVCSQTGSINAVVQSYLAESDDYFIHVAIPLFLQSVLPHGKSPKESGIALKIPMTVAILIVERPGR